MRKLKKNNIILKSASKSKRIAYIDFLRGLAIFLMLVTHINGFFLFNNEKPLDYITYFGATVCFVIFLFCFGFGYGIKLGKDKSVSFKKHIKRSAILLSVYYFSAFVMELFLSNGLDWASIQRILILAHQPEYTQFLLTFFIYAVLTAIVYEPLRRLLKGSKKRTFVLLIMMQLLSFILYAVSYNLASYDISIAGSDTVQSIFIGKRGVSTFAILPYLPVFVYGLIWGFVVPSKKLARRYEKVLVWTVFISTSSLYILMKLLGLSRWERWPPSILYLLLGIATISGVISLKKYIRRLGPVSSYLSFLGRNSLSIFVLNVVLIGFAAWMVSFRKYNSEMTFFINFFIIASISFTVYLWNLIISTLRAHKRKKFISRLILLCTIIFLIAMVASMSLLASRHPEFNMYSIRERIYPDVVPQDSCDYILGYPDDMIKTHVDREWILIDNESYYNQTVTAIFDQRYEHYLGEWELINMSYMIPGTKISGQLERVDDQPSKDHYYLAEIDLVDVMPGKYEFWITANMPCDVVKVTTEYFYISYPLYVAWTHDWEGVDVEQRHLNDMELLSQKYGVPMSHYFNPYIYVPGVMSQTRAQYLTDWVIRRRDEHGDSIGLHLHMYPKLIEEMLRPTEVRTVVRREVQEEDEEGNIVTNIVEEEQVETLFDVRYSPKWGGYRGMGEDIPVSAYNYDELVYIFNWSVEMFQEKRLGKPAGFRAGGWFADMNTLRALQDTGFLYDTSGRTFAYRGTNKMRLQWDLKETTQPYQPNVNDQNSSAPPNIRLWEIPNNGADSWVYSGEQMINRVSVNWDGSYLLEKKIVVYLSHPHWFYADKPKMEAVFSHLSQYNNSKDGGPVVYINMDQAYNIWAE